MNVLIVMQFLLNVLNIIANANHEYFNGRNTECICNLKIYSLNISLYILWNFVSWSVVWMAARIISDQFSLYFPNNWYYMILTIHRCYGFRYWTNQGVDSMNYSIGSLNLIGILTCITILFDLIGRWSRSPNGGELL